jgi:MSHA biogenesis protein MshN
MMKFNPFSFELPQIKVSGLKMSGLKMSGLVALLASGTYLNSQAQNDELSSMKIATFVEPNAVWTASIDKGYSEKVELSPLFETKLRHVPADYQSPAKKPKKETAKAIMLTQLTPSSKPDVAPAEVINAITETVSAPEVTIRKQIGVEQKSANHYRQALAYLQQGRVAEAQASLAAALDVDATNHEARQVLAGLLLDNKRLDEASTTLAAGLAIAPEQTDFRMALARLQVEAGNMTEALNTLEQGLPFAKNHADYLHFFATLLQRANRHEEAITHYTAALSLNTSAPTGTLIGLGISLQAMGKLAQSQEAFALVQASATLNPELALFVEQRIKEINQSLQN